MQQRPNLADVAKNFRAAAAWLESVGLATLLAEEPLPEQGDGPRPQISRPTEVAAVARADGERDWVLPIQRSILASVAAGNEFAIAIVVELSDLQARLPKDLSRLVCRSAGCVRLAAVGRAGYCDACRMWLRRETQAAEREGREPAAEVPAEVVERRAWRGTQRDARSVEPPPSPS